MKATLATKEFALGGRRADWSFALNAGGFSLCADGGSDFLLDRHTGERRAATFEDWLEYIRRKAERHTGQEIVFSDRERRMPLVFLWPRVLRYLREKR